MPAIVLVVGGIGSQVHAWNALGHKVIAEIGALSIDNNLSERMVRPMAIGRKNYLFLGSDNGGKAAAVLYSFMASTKANQVEPFAYVRDLLVRFKRNSPPAVAALLPKTWLTAHLEARRCWSQ